MSLINLANGIFSRYQKLGKIGDLNDAIVFGRQALSFCPPGHPDRSTSLSNLAGYLPSRYKCLGEIDDLNEAIVLGRNALSLCPLGHPLRATSLNNHANLLASRFHRVGRIDDLNEAIFLDQEALSLYPPGHPDRSTTLNDLAVCLSFRYGRLGGIDDLNEAISLGRDALSLCPPGHPDRSTSLDILPGTLISRYQRLGEISDLNEAIILHREAVSLFMPGHPRHTHSLNNLAGCLAFRNQQLGRIDDLNEAIVLARDTLTFYLPGHPDHPMSLSNLAVSLSSRHKQLGEIDDLNEAIVIGRDALSLCAQGHPDRSMSLNNLAECLYSRYGQLGGTDDLNEAIILGKEALSLRLPQGHPHLMSLNDLANYLFTWYQKLVGIDELNVAIALCREAHSLCPPEHPEHSMPLHNLASYLYSRYAQLGEVDDLNEAIALGKDVLSLCLRGHPHRPTSLNNLANHLSSRYKRLMGVDDLNEAVVLGKEALSLFSPRHPGRSQCLWDHARHLSMRFTKLAHAEDKEDLFALFVGLRHLSRAVSSFDLSATREWVNVTERFHHPATLLAYETTLRLLAEHLAALPTLPQHLTLLKSLSSSLAVDAFSACLRNQSPIKAVKLLEQGRGLFWTQLTRLRSPLDDVIAAGPLGKALADEFSRLTSLIHITLQSPTVDQHDRVCRLNLELNKVVSEIHELPNLSRSLLPALFSDFQRAASGGPVIIMNAGRSCDALVVFVDRDPVHIPLPITRDDVRGFSSRLHGLTKLAKIMDMTKSCHIFLRELWDRVVSRIIDVLRTTCPLQSRIWWCPTAEFSLLPLHAASPFRKGQRGVSDLYTSSYATTLTALLRARRPSEDATNENKRFIAIGQAAAKGAGELLAVGTELTDVGQLIDGCATFTCIEGEDACVFNVSDKLCQNEWVHFACHGVPNMGQPFESAFALRDGPFTVQQIIQVNLENPEFVYLSACHTTVGYQESPDEVTMQFAGFCSVIGTMWAVDDAHTNGIASQFYMHMVDESGCLDYTRAARALRKTMRSLRDIPIDQCILYIHLGA